MDLRDAARASAHSLMLFSRKPDKGDVEERLQKLERGLRALEMDWESVLERLQARLAKLGRTRQRLEELANDGKVEAAGVEPPPQPLSALDPISQRILARRSRIARGTEVPQ